MVVCSSFLYFFFFSFTDLAKDSSQSTSSTASLRMEPFYAQAKSQTHCFRRCESFAGLSNAIATYECRFFCFYIYIYALVQFRGAHCTERESEREIPNQKKKKKNWPNDQGGARPTGGHPLKWTCCRVKSPKWTDETVNYNYIDIYLFFYIFVLVSFHKMQMILLSVIFFVVCYGNICWHAKNWQAIWCKKATNLTNGKAPAAVSFVVVYGIWSIRGYIMANTTKKKRRRRERGWCLTDQPNCW